MIPRPALGALNSRSAPSLPGKAPYFTIWMASVSLVAAGLADPDSAVPALGPEGSSKQECLDRAKTALAGGSEKIAES